MTSIAREPRLVSRAEIVRRRLLPVPGIVRVHEGDRVGPRDIVAEATVGGSLHVIDVAYEMGVGQRAAARAMRISPGEHVGVGAILASRAFGKRQVVAPCSGTIQEIDQGCVLLRRDAQTLTLTAYVPGKVIETYPHHGVAIRTYGALVRGIWGTGDEREGLLAVVAQSPDEVLTWEQVGLRYRGTIVVGGILEDPRVLYRASQFRVSGLVAGSMLPALRATCEQLWLPVVITEGMGRLPMAEPLFRLLSKQHGRAAVLSGSPLDGSDTPELIIPGNVGDDALPVTPRLIEVGAEVRLTRPPFVGQIAHIVALHDEPQETAIGTFAEGAGVRLADGRTVFVPYANLELLQ